MLNKKVLYTVTSILTLLLILGTYIWYQKYQAERREVIIFDDNITTSNYKDVNDITIFGVWDCLPDLFTSEDNPICQRGIRGSTGNYFLLLYPKEGMKPATERSGTVSFTGTPKNTIESPDGKKVNFFYVSKVH